MPDESQPQSGDCVFCDREATQRTLLHESRNFYVVADFAPVADAHLLLIPRAHLPHLAALPRELDTEFQTLKTCLGNFVRGQYGRLAYWENGVFGQSVPHAHLHVISIELDPSLIEARGAAFEGLQQMREHQQAAGGHYFMVEQDGVGRYMPPDPEVYGRLIRHARERNGGMWRYGAAERRLHGKAVIAAMMARWREHGREYLPSFEHEAAGQEPASP